MSIAEVQTVELAGPRSVRVMCRKCGEWIRIEFGQLSRAEAQVMIAKLNAMPRQCPGNHTELSGWRYL